MSKIKANYKINDKLFETIGIKNKNKLIFKEDNISFSVIINDNEIILNRENNEYKLNITLNDNSECIYELIGHSIMNLNVKKNKLQIEENKIVATYKLNDEIFNLEINYEVI